MSDLKDFVIENGVLKKYVGTDANVTIPEEVFQIGPNAFKNNKNIVCVALSDKLTSIGANAFCGCTALSKISFPSSVTRIGNNAFEGCSSLVSIVIPFGVSKIEKGLFKDCTSLISVSLPESVTSIGDHKFRYNFDGAFEYCESLKSVNLPESLKLIGANSFRFCTSLESVCIPKNVKTIGYDAFVACGAKTISYPFSDDSVCAKTTVFSGCKQVESIIANSKEGYNALWKMLEKESHIRILRNAIKENNTDANIIAKIKSNKYYLFEIACQNENVELAKYILSLYSKLSIDELEKLIDTATGSVAITKLLTEYKERYFESAVSKTSEDNENTSKSVEEWKKLFAFESCSGGLTIKNYKGNETEVTIPSVIGDEKVVEIGEKAFSPDAMKLNAEAKKARNKIKKIIISEGIETIGAGAFMNCAELQSVQLPDSLKAIKGGIWSGAFQLCAKLTNLTLPKNLTEIGVWSFGYCNSITSINIPGAVIKICDDAFCDCTNLNSVIISNGVTEIGENVFQGCNSLKILEISDSVIKIGTGAFSGCYCLADENGFVIVNHTLYGYYGTASEIIIPENVLEIAANAFSDCSILTSVKFTENVESIGDGAFARCDNLKEVEFSNNMNFIGISAFSGCKKLKAVSIPGGVRKISYRAFEECKKLTTVTLCDGVETIDNLAFFDCTALKAIFIPKTVKEIDKSSFSGSDKLTIKAIENSCAEKFAKKNRIPFVAE